MKKETIILTIAITIFVVYTSSVLSDPMGASIQEGQSSRRPDSNVSNITAQGGNVTWIVADLSQTTNTWQGYYGTVQGGIVLESSDGDTFYDWSVVGAVGEIVASRNIVTDWSNINCTNQSQIYAEESSLNILDEHSDGINDTFVSTSHPDFEIADRTMSGCRSTKTYNSTTAQAKFWNVLLSTNSTNVVYTVQMDDNVIGFNGTVVDFQLLVPVDKSTGFATYLIYVELD